MQFIDVSQYNGVINWSKVKADGVFIRIGYRGYSVGVIKADSKFKDNVKGAISAGIPVGFYFMSQAINEAEARAEAEYCYEQTKAYNFNLPIVYDSELSGEKNKNGRADKLTRSQRTAICKAFCERLIQLGVKAGVYASTSWFKTNLYVSELLKYFVWCAQYASKCTAAHRVDAWQYTSKGSVSGINGNVDLSYCYVDFKNVVANEVNDNYLKCDYKGVSIVAALNSISVDSSFQYRKKLAVANGISNYTGTSTQNTTLLGLLKAGKLKKV